MVHICAAHMRGAYINFIAAMVVGGVAVLVATWVAVVLGVARSRRENICAVHMRGAYINLCAAHMHKTTHFLSCFKGSPFLRRANHRYHSIGRGNHTAFLF